MRLIHERFGSQILFSLLHLPAPLFAGLTSVSWMAKTGVARD
jgi:hypothetical protein